MVSAGWRGRVAVVGLGVAGAAVAGLLADQGCEVVVLELAEDPRPVGAGLWLQPMGQRVLAGLGVLGPLRAASSEVSRVDVRTSAGRRLVQVGYDALPGSGRALGVHRGTLFSLLHAEAARRGVEVRLGVDVAGVRLGPDGVVVDLLPPGDTSPLGPFDLVVGCDGSRSRVRAAMDVARRDRPYAYGALWTIVDDADGLAGDRLFQSLRGTREYLGVLPTGAGQASVFWSARTADLAGLVAAGPGSWRRRAAPLAQELAPLVQRVEHLLPATYRDVVVASPHRVGRVGAGGRSSAGAVLLGDAVHAMSPQLGTGASLALADAWSLARQLGAHARLDDGLRAHAASRAAHVRWYQWWTRLMMPVFQSDLDPLALPRDLLAPTVAGFPGVAPHLVRTLLGDRTSPWSAWSPPD